MFTLFVSEDAGASYHRNAQSEKVAELLPRTEELNHAGLRWTIKNKDGRLIEVSEIHNRIMNLAYASIEQG